jgi:hypothetical protein
MKKKKGFDFSKLPEDCSDKWVALSHDEKELLACDHSLAKVAMISEKKGEKNPVLLKVPSDSISY